MISWSSPVISKLEVDSEDNPFGRPGTPDELSWIGSLLSLGAIFGPFLAAFSSNTLGRKWTLIILGVPGVISFFVLAFSQTPELYYFARTIAGIALGGVFTVLPTYLAEISDDAVRGAVGTTMNIFITSGLLLSYSIGPYVSIMWFSVICAIIPCIFIILFAIFMPETPQYLLAKGREDQAKVSFDRFRGGKGSPEEFAEMKALQKSSEGGSIRDLYKSRGNLKALTITVALLSFQQLSGINVVLAYAEGIFADTDGIIPAKESPIILGVVQVIASFVTPLIVDRYGRKILLLISAVGMLISEVLLGLYFYLDDTSGISWLPVVCLIVYISTYGMGFGPLPWTMMAELLPSNVKAVASSLSASWCWLISFILTKYFDSLSESIGQAGSFWMFSAFNAVAVVVTVLFVPETKGKSPKEIEDMLNS